MALLAIALTGWLCVFLARPAKPLPGNEVQELVYRRLLGRQERLLLAALVITAVTFFAQVAQLPARITAGPEQARTVTGPAEECVDAGRTCVTRRLDGTLHVVTRGPDGMWHALIPAGE